MRPFLSVCIPSFNRPHRLDRLLRSIDGAPGNLEIVVCEDRSPRRCEIESVVRQFTLESPYKVRYFENPATLGYDGNLRRLVELAEGEFVLFMGDDDVFVPRALGQFLRFLWQHRDKKYVLRSYVVRHRDGGLETFRYLPRTAVLPPGETTVAWLFKRSVTICGFTVSRDEALSVATSDLDGTLLYQVYLMAEICLKYPSIYFHVPIVEANQTYRDDRPMFGVAEAEKGRYTPGEVTEDNSINFTRSYFEVAAYIDRRHGTRLVDAVRRQLSAYAYPFLSIQRKRGVRRYLGYARRLEKEFGFGRTIYYWLYKWGLLILGEGACDRVIRLAKRVIGYSPNL